MQESAADYSYWELSKQLPLVARQHRVIPSSRRYNCPKSTGSSSGCFRLSSA